MKNISFGANKIIGPWPLEPPVICHAKINLKCFHKGKKKLVWGGDKSVISTTSQIIGAAAAAPAAPLSTPMNV